MFDIDDVSINVVKVMFSSKGKKYSYLLPARLINKVHTGDFVVVPTTYGDMPYKVVEVTDAIHVDSDVLYKFDYKYKYIVDKVDTTDYLEQKVAQEKAKEFSRIKEDLRSYCSKYGIEFWTEYEIERSPHYSTTNLNICLADSNNYKPSAYFE